MEEARYRDAQVTLWQGDCREVLAEVPAGSVQCCITSPPYWGLRDYQIAPSVWGGDPACAHQWRRTTRPPRHSDTGATGSTLQGSTKTQEQSQRTPSTDAACVSCGAWQGCLGLEPAHCCKAILVGDAGCGQCYVCHIVEVFQAVKRVLRDDATLWLNLGDSYAGSSMTGGIGHGTLKGTQQGAIKQTDIRFSLPRHMPQALKSKNLLGLPWRCALALQADGWTLRSDIIWAKPCPMPESVRDRPTRSHEYVFLFTKRSRYYYDSAAIAEEAMYGEHHAKYQGTYRRQKIESLQKQGAMNGTQYQQGLQRAAVNPTTRNARNVWTISPEPFAGAHFATFPMELVRRCLLAGSRCGDTVLDPFVGSGTTALVAKTYGRHCLGIDQNSAYLAMAQQRLRQEVLLLGPPTEENARCLD